jgi:hypothetical protein
MEMELLRGSFLADQEGHLFWCGRDDLLADEDVGQGLVVVQKSAIGVAKQQIIIDFSGHARRKLDLGQYVLDQRPFLAVGKDASVLEEIYHFPLLLLSIILLTIKQTQ